MNKLAAFSCMSLTLACAGAAKADSFSPGQFITYTENDWGSGTASTSLLIPDFNTVYASANDVLVVGVIGVANQYLMTFASASDIETYIPATGPPGQLTASLIGPTSSPTGAFGGDTVALTLNIDFNDAGYLQGSSSILFGNLVFADLGSIFNSDGGGGTVDVSGLNGLTVSDFLGIANTCLSGGACPDGGLDGIAIVANDLNFAFESGTPSVFADDYLELPTSSTPALTPEPSSFLLLASGLAGLGLLRRRWQAFRAPPLER